MVPVTVTASSPNAVPLAADDGRPWDAVVIGSGIGGLVTASQLAAKGAKVLVLERYLIPGGSGGSFRRAGYTFDVGASMIFGFGEKGHTNLLTRALADVGEHCDTIPDPAQLAYHLPGGIEVAVDRDYERFLADLTALFPHEAKGIRAFYDTCWQVFRCLDAMPLLSLEDPAYLAKVFFKAPLACLGLARWLPVNVGAVARTHISDPALLKFIDMECFCWSVMPADRTPMINAGMVFSDRHAGGINYPRGGVGVIAEKLVAGLRKHGGVIRYRARVVKVLLENGSAVGVRLADGREYRGKTVISNATRWDTFEGLLADHDLPESGESNACGGLELWWMCSSWMGMARGPRVWGGGGYGWICVANAIQKSHARTHARRKQAPLPSRAAQNVCFESATRRVRLSCPSTWE